MTTGLSNPPSGGAPKKEWSDPDLVLDQWHKYEQIAMHFNDLLIRFRTQALAGLAAVGGLATVLGNTKGVPTPVLAVFTGVLAVFWAGAWILDAGYYSKLLSGAVAELVDFERRTWASDIASAHKLADDAAFTRAEVADRPKIDEAGKKAADKVKRKGGEAEEQRQASEAAQRKAKKRYLATRPGSSPTVGYRIGLSTRVSNQAPLWRWHVHAFYLTVLLGIGVVAWSLNHYPASPSVSTTPPVEVAGHMKVDGAMAIAGEIKCVDCKEPDCSPSKEIQKKSNAPRTGGKPREAACQCRCKAVGPAAKPKEAANPDGSVELP